MKEKISSNKVNCLICNRSMFKITNSHLRKHSLTPQEYKKKFPNSNLISLMTLNKHKSSMLGKKHSKKTKRKLSLAHKGKVLSEETRIKIGKSLKGIKRSEEYKQKLRNYYKKNQHPFKGKKHSQEALRKISETGKGRIPWNKGRRCSEEIRNKISKKLKGRPLSRKTRIKMSISHKGKKISESAKKKISIAHKGKIHSKKHIINFLKSIKKSPNKFEKECMALFKNHNLPLKYVGDFNNLNFFIAGRVPDFVSTNDKKIIVEVFHRYFKEKQYGSVRKYKRERTNIFSKYGWKTLFFTCEDIRLNFNKCLNILKKELY